MRQFSWTRWGLVVLFTLIGLGFWYFDLSSLLTLKNLRAQQDFLLGYVEQHPLHSICWYGLLYILMAACSLPGATVLTLAGGALFGLFWGTLIVSFASTCGASLACLVARYLLRDWVTGKFPAQLETVNKGIRQDGAVYLLSLRLVPLFPFFLVNLLSGLTGIRLRTFYLISQVGMLPATLVYVNAGRELAKIDSISAILSPGLLLSFVLLGIFPVLMKKLLAWLQNRKKSQPSSNK